MQRPFAWQAAGVGLFLFIPAVLYLFVQHPEPVGASAAVGVALMLGHRFLARPYLERVRDRKCVWCNRWRGGGAAGLERFEVRAGPEAVEFVACPGHAAPARRFFAWVDRLRLPLQLGIALPLLALLAALTLAAFGDRRWLGDATEAFRFVVGLTVNVAALGPWLPYALAGPPRAAFPLHNFSLLGVSATLWIFRGVGVWWLLAAGRAILERAPLSP